MKVLHDKEDIEMFQEDEVGRIYLKYNDEIGGNPIGLVVPFGYPPGVAELGGPLKVYEECIRLNTTWEQLLQYDPNPADVMY